MLFSVTRFLTVFYIIFLLLRKITFLLKILCVHKHIKKKCNKIMCYTCMYAFHASIIYLQLNKKKKQFYVFVCILHFNKICKYTQYKKKSSSVYNKNALTERNLTPHKPCYITEIKKGMYWYI